MEKTICKRCGCELLPADMQSGDITHYKEHVFCSDLCLQWYITMIIEEDIAMMQGESNYIQMDKRQTPIEARLKIMFETEWLSVNIIHEREATDDEIKKAVEWAAKMVEGSMVNFRQWEKDYKADKRKARRAQKRK
ncbi:MAG: hypothetical protein EXR21_10305 [Flavobacteriaceae bacterium]|nr:hypothetical protein [Flavobacteriaceae bacterium]